MSREGTERAALLLIATESDWAGRSLESVLMVHGYAVLRTQNGRDALGLAHRTRPDAVILDQNLREIGGIEVCRMLRDDPLFDAGTPVVVIAASPASHAERAAAYAAGAWTFCTQPLDPDILVLELATFLRAKRAIEAARQSSLVDSATGLLNAPGFERWAETMTARAVRRREPLSCVVLTPPERSADTKSTGEEDIIATFIEQSRAHMRQSDIVGVTPDGNLALLAPDTDGNGALGLIQRLRKALDAVEASLPSGRASSEFRAGYFALDQFGEGTPSASEILNRASRAVDFAGRAPGNLAVGYNQLPLN
jgi:PleD family two-component response regulator